MTVEEAIKSHIKECKSRISRIKNFIETNKRADVEGCEEKILYLKTIIQLLEDVEELKKYKDGFDIEKIVESIEQLPAQDFMGVLHIPRTATINRIKRGGNCELPEV